MVHPTRRRALPLLVTLVLAALLVALPGSARADQAAADGASTPPGQAWVRFGHFVPGMGTASIELDPVGAADGAPITLTPGAAYGKVSAYRKVTPGTYTATVRDPGAGADQEPILSRSVELAGGEARTIAVLGTSDEPRLSVLSDDLTPPAPGTARVRVLSASAAAGTVSVTAEGGPTIAEQAVLGQATGYTTVPAGTWTVTLAGSTASSTTQSVPITSGSVYTVVAVDDEAGGVELRVLTDAAGAVVAPQGGAATGGGGTAARPAPGSHGSPAPAIGTGALLVLAAALLIRRRRSVTP